MENLIRILKASPLARKILAWPIRIRSGIRKGRSKEAARLYDQSVRGGILKLHPPNLGGTFAVPALSDLARRVVIEGVYEAEVAEVIRALELKDGVAVNVGANVGFFAVFLAREHPRINRVIAIEPNPEAYRLLVENIGANGLADRIETIQTCIGEREELVEFSFIPGMPEYSSIETIAHVAVREKERLSMNVPVRKLGDVLDADAKINLMFVDTEGAELLVFKGAENVIVRDQPVLLFECSDALLLKFGHSSQQLIRYVEGLGYRVVDALCPSNPLRHPFEGEVLAYPVTVHDG